MRTTRGLLMTGLAAVLVTVFMSACLPPPKKTLFAERWAKFLARIVTYTVVDECRLVDACGNDVKTIAVKPSTPIMWVNRAQVAVVVEFSSLEIVGWDAILLNPGESRTTTTRSTMVTGKSYEIRVVCKTDPPIYGPTPPIKQEEPPGSP